MTTACKRPCQHGGSVLGSGGGPTESVTVMADLPWLRHPRAKSGTSPLRVRISPHDPAESTHVASMGGMFSEQPTSHRSYLHHVAEYEPRTPCLVSAPGVPRTAARWIRMGHIDPAAPSTAMTMPSRGVSGDVNLKNYTEGICRLGLTWLGLVAVDALHTQ